MPSVNSSGQKPFNLRIITNRTLAITLVCVGLLLNGTACAPASDEPSSSATTDAISGQADWSENPYRNTRTWEANHLLNQSCGTGAETDAVHFTKEDLRFFDSAKLYRGGGVCVKTDNVAEQATAVAIRGGRVRLHVDRVEDYAMTYALGGGTTTTLHSIDVGSIAIANGENATISKTAS